MRLFSQKRPSSSACRGDFITEEISQGDSQVGFGEIGDRSEKV
jgi:hypothetical protein